MILKVHPDETRFATRAIWSVSVFNRNSLHSLMRVQLNFALQVGKYLYSFDYIKRTGLKHSIERVYIFKTNYYGAQ